MYCCVPFLFPRNGIESNDVRISFQKRVSSVDNYCHSRRRIQDLVAVRQALVRCLAGPAFPCYLSFALVRVGAAVGGRECCAARQVKEAEPDHGQDQPHGQSGSTAAPKRARVRKSLCERGRKKEKRTEMSAHSKNRGKSTIKTRSPWISSKKLLFAFFRNRCNCSMTRCVNGCVHSSSTSNVSSSAAYHSQVEGASRE